MRDGGNRQRDTIFAVVAAGLIMSAALGARQTFGLFVQPLAVEDGLAVSWIAFAMALHNLSWGLAQPFAGALADRHGAAPLVLAGTLIFGAGLALSAVVVHGLALVLGMGLLVGLGISCTGFGVVMTAVGKAASPEQRSQAMGLASAGGSLGQVALVPLTQTLIGTWGPALALLALAAAIVATAPFGSWLDRGRSAEPIRMPAVPLRRVLRQAAGHRGYRLLTLGFFTCGFQLAFIATHLPGYLSLCQMPAGTGALALALIGLFNMAGSWGCGWLGGRFRQNRVLGHLYLLRGAAIALFFILPKTEISVIAFAAVMGLLWLGTVPLTSGLIARMFGVENLGVLFGLCFLSHQIGSFLGAWTGGLVFDWAGTYGPVWMATALAGLLAALLHFAIDDRPAAPMRPAGATA